MSNLINKLYKKATDLLSSPEEQKKYKEEQEVIAKLKKEYTAQLISDKEALLEKPNIHASYCDFDLDLIKTLNSQRQKLLDNIEEEAVDDLKKKWTDLSDKYNIVAKPKSVYRANLGLGFLFGKQLLHDTKQEEMIKIIKFYQNDVLKFLEENKFIDSDVIFAKYIESIVGKYITFLREYPDSGKIIEGTFRKLEKNKWVLDFEEDGGPPLPDELKASKKAELAAAADKEQDTFSANRLLTKAAGYAITIFIILLILFLLGIGSSFAVNLNIYKPVAFRILYAIYGAIFAIIVIPYTLLYRWAYKGKPPKYYGFIPLIPRYFVHKPVQFLLGWLTYRPDDQMWDLEEWRHHASA